MHPRTHIFCHRCHREVQPRYEGEKPGYRDCEWCGAPLVPTRTRG